MEQLNPDAKHSEPGAATGVEREESRVERVLNVITALLALVVAPKSQQVPMTVIKAAAINENGITTKPFIPQHIAGPAGTPRTTSPTAPQQSRVSVRRDPTTRGK